MGSLLIIIHDPECQSPEREREREKVGYFYPVIVHCCIAGRAHYSIANDNSSPAGFG